MVAADAWMDRYLTGGFLSASVSQETQAGDPLLILGTVLDLLTARGVPVVVERFDRAIEDSERHRPAWQSRPRTRCLTRPRSRAVTP